MYTYNWTTFLCSWNTVSQLYVNKIYMLTKGKNIPFFYSKRLGSLATCYRCSCMHYCAPLDERPQNERDALEVAWAASALVTSWHRWHEQERDRRESWKRLDLLEVWRYMLCWRPMEKSKEQNFRSGPSKACAGLIAKTRPILCSESPALEPETTEGSTWGLWGCCGQGKWDRALNEPQLIQNRKTHSTSQPHYKKQHLFASSAACPQASPGLMDSGVGHPKIWQSDCLRNLEFHLSRQKEGLCSRGQP